MTFQIIDKDPERIGRWVCARNGGEWVAQGSTAIGLEKNGRLVAGVVFDNYNKASVNMHVASDGSKGWMNREYLWFCFHYPFKILGVKRITGLVAESNLAARKFDEHIGFELETSLKDAHPDGDLLIYKMTPDKCRWLDRRALYGRQS